jgi:hypothetical protein
MPGRDEAVLSLLTSLIVVVLSGEGAVLATHAAEPPSAPPPSLEQLQLAPGLPALPVVPDWRVWLEPPGLQAPPALLTLPGPAPVRRLQLRWVYRRLVELPELDRVGRFAHVDLARTGLSGGPELLRVAPEPPRENYSRAQELTPGWSWWYLSARGWAVGMSTGTRFLISDHAGTTIDPFTTEARCELFLP